MTWSKSRWQEESGNKHAVKKAAQWLKADHNLEGVFEDMPTAKVGTVAAFQHHLSHKLRHMPLLHAHFHHKRNTALRWRSYRKRQAAMSHICDAITGKHRHTLVGFGDGRFSSAGPTQSLRRRLRSQCCLYDVDEFRTSMLCCACHQRMAGMTSPAQGMKTCCLGSLCYVWELA